MVAVQTMMWLWVAVVVVQVVLDLGLALAMFNEAPRKVIDSKQTLRRFIEAVVLLVMAIGACLFLAWVHKVSINSRGFGARGITSPGWAVGWFFVPLASFVKPYVGHAGDLEGQPRPVQLEIATG